MDTREQYIREAFDNMKRSKAGMRTMTQEQKNAVDQSIKAIEEALDYSSELFDLRLSDMERLRSALFKLQQNFEPEPTEYQSAEFAKFGLSDKEGAE